MHAQSLSLPTATLHPFDSYHASIDCFVKVFDEPDVELTLAPQHLLFDELAAGLLDDAEVARLEVLAAQNQDIHTLLEAFRPLEESFNDHNADLTIDCWLV